jgi:UDP-N-acetylglucosamine 3-dehydrogenase
MINIGFIGLGGMGRGQVEAFAQMKGCRIHAGADPSEAARGKFAEWHPEAACFADYRPLLNDPQVDAVVIAVPTLLHREVGLAALEAGKAVLMEKPLARTVADARQLIEASNRSGRLLMVAHCRRFDPVWGAWADVVRSGRLGSPLLWRNVMAGRGPGGWYMDDRVGGGPMLDGAVHNYDFANYLWGDPQKVVGSGIKLDKDVTAVDTATAIVHYGNGCQLMVSWSWGTRGGWSFEVIGPEGTIQHGTGSLEPTPEEREQHAFYCFTANESGESELIRTPKRSSMYQDQARHFIECVLGEAQCRAPGEEAIKAVAVAEAVLEAARNHGAVDVRW